MVVIRVTSKFRQILSRHQKIRIAELFILMIIAGFMEMMSVSMMIPFVTAVINPDSIMDNFVVRKIILICGINGNTSFLIFLSVIMASLYMIKNIFLLLQMTIQEKFVQGNKFELQKRLMRSFMSRPYEFFLTAQSGEIVRIVSQDTTNAFYVLTMLLQVFSEGIVTITLLITIFVITPFLTIMMGAILLLTTMIIYTISKKRLQRFGEKQIRASANMNQTLLQSIQGIKEIKLMRKEEFFQNRYNVDGMYSVKATYISQLLSSIPRFMLEAIAMSSFFVIMALMIYNGIDLEIIIPVISGVAMASVRLLPSMNRISYSLSKVTYEEPAVDKLLENMRYLEEVEAKVHNSDDNREKKNKRTNQNSLKGYIKVENITYQYPTGYTPVLENANLEIGRGQSVGIVGASGSGKTTLVDVVLGLLKPQSGKVSMDGTDISLDMDNWLSRIGYIPQSIFMLDGNIRENVAFGISENEIDDELIWKALKEASLDEYVRSLPEGLNTEIGERGVRISGGQRQRIGIARALYGEPDILFFDEATSALDNETEAAIMDSITKLQGKITMVIIAHRLTTIEGCDAIYRVENGKIVRER